MSGGGVARWVASPFLYLATTNDGRATRPSRSAIPSPVWWSGYSTRCGVCVCVCATDDAMTEVLTSEDPFSGPSKAVGPVLSATLEVRDFIAPVRPSRQFGGPDTAVGVVFA